MVLPQHDIFKARMRRLSPREREVMPFVAIGKPNKLIAFELSLSQRTVESHRARMFRKLGLRNAVELAACWAVYVQPSVARAGNPGFTLPGNSMAAPAAH